MKFNMGCGARKMTGFVNVDAVAQCEPDEVVDLEVTPWPWPSDIADEIRFIHSLEHMGQDPKVFLAIMSETYRIAADGCVVQINVPHPRHDDFLGDPTHVRPITPQTLSLFDKQLCDQFVAANAANTPFAHYLGVDFQTLNTEMLLVDRYYALLKTGEVTESDLQQLIRSNYNVVKELRMTLKVRKATAT